jgi:hypothetical protein
MGLQADNRRTDFPYQGRITTRSLRRRGLLSFGSACRSAVWENAMQTLRVGDVVRAGDFVATVLHVCTDGRVIAERRECGILLGPDVEVVERSTVWMRLAIRARNFALSVGESGLGWAIYYTAVPASD